MYITAENTKDFLITGSVVVVAAFLAVALYHLITVLKRLNGVIEANEKNIKESLSRLPDAISNISSAVADVKVITQKAGVVVGMVENGVSGVVASAKGTTSSVLEIARTFGDVATGIAGFFNRRKKNSGKD